MLLVGQEANYFSVSSAPSPSGQCLQGQSLGRKITKVVWEKNTNWWAQIIASWKASIGVGQKTDFFLAHSTGPSEIPLPSHYPFSGDCLIPFPMQISSPQKCFLSMRSIQSDHIQKHPCFKRHSKALELFFIPTKNAYIWGYWCIFSIQKWTAI